MISLRIIGRVFYVIAIAVMGLVTIFYNAFPYMLLPAIPIKAPGLAYVLGVLLFVAGVGIVFGKKAKQAALLMATIFLLIFCFLYMPYELFVSPNYKQIGEWENSAKELAFAGGAFAIAGCYILQGSNKLLGFLEKLVPAGNYLYAIPIVYFGILHFVFAKESADYIPAWIPWHLFWMYFCGVALIGGGLSIILKIKTTLFAALLGLMMFIWLVILHIPRVAAAAPADRADEITSACLALAYSGTALVIAGAAKKRQSLTL